MENITKGEEKEMPKIAIGIAFHSKSQPLLRAVKSALKQEVPGMETLVLVLDSSPDGSARYALRSLALHPRIRLVRGRARCAHAARNRLIAYAETHVREALWHVRLDADDVFTNTQALASVFCEVKRGHQFIVAGNRQVTADGRLIGRNIPTRRLVRRDALLKRLMAMAAGDFRAELPSCNLILRAGLGWRYPARPSAEDHWLLASILLKSPADSVCVRQVEMVDYHVSGMTTLENRHSGAYLTQRKLLLEAATCWRRRE
jgi:glycosyltransferase involved in cell wall biosynthesis